MEAFGLTMPPIGPIQQTNYPMRNRPVVRLTDEGGRELVEMNWGLVPSWAKEKKVGRNTFNARMESLVEGKPMFRSAFKSRRCLLVGTSYIEYRDESGKKLPYEFLVDGGAPYAYAGLWEIWGPREDPLLSCSMITTTPNDVAAAYHDRMPVILRPEDYEAWLDPKANTRELLPLLAPLEDGLLSVRPTVIERRAPRLDSA
jgi:putative SOS response-associated peptidase YedK